MSGPDPNSQTNPAAGSNSAQTAQQAPMTPAIATRLRTLTPARVGLSQTGVSLATGEVLDFQLSHARARNAVHTPLQPASLLAELRSLLQTSLYNESSPIPLHSAARDRQTYLQRPDLGRKLDEASRQSLQEYPRHPFDLSIVIADGLSALAVERHAIPLLAELLPVLSQSSPELHLAPICIVEQGRVAIADEVAHALSANLAIILIGERPGLSSPDSLGAYITWQPRPGITTDAQRNCISNIRPEGLSYPQAAARLLHYIQEARSKRLTGVALKDPDPTLETKQSHELQSGSHPGVRR
jgi:ethanolamine ammonia-lyase small subunit